MPAIYDPPTSLPNSVSYCSIHTVCTLGQLNFRLFATYLLDCSIAPLAHGLPLSPGIIGSLFTEWNNQLINWLISPFSIETHWVKGLHLRHLKSSPMLWLKLIWNIFQINECLLILVQMLKSSSCLTMIFLLVYRLLFSFVCKLFILFTILP